MAVNMAEKWIGNMKNERRVKFINKISACDIILFGAGHRAHCFYNNYKYLLNIVMCVSNNPKEIECSFEDGSRLPVVRPSESFVKKKNNTFIVICVDNDTEIEKQLISYGMTAGEHYIHYGLFDLLMTRKKIAILYGVCYMRPLCHCLKKSVEFSQEYEAFYWLSYKGMTEAEHAIFLCLLKVCDLYLYNPSISRQERALEEGYLSHLPDCCVRLKVPSIGAEVYHPQTIRLEQGRKAYNVVDAQSAYGPFTAQDWYINQMIDDGKKLAEIKKAIKDEKFLAYDYVRENYEIQIRKIELQESASDIKICDYLVYNHKKKRLFLDGIHIANDPICEIANRILNRLGYAFVDYAEEVEGLLIYASEVPIYPSVIKGLQLSVYETEEPRYNLFTFHGYQSVTFDEYIELYYDYCKQIKKYMEKGYFI